MNKERVSHMIELTTKEMYHTSLGLKVIVNTSEILKVGETVLINGKKYRIKAIAFSHNPNDGRIILTLF